jgi:ACS family hexuronate transporter-like MFS transporter
MMPTAADSVEDLSAISGASRSAPWRWYICFLLLLATVVNYMDRLTTNTLATEIKVEFHLNQEQYGNLELGFGLAFAAGSLLFGWLVDRIGVYWLYPVVLIGWSLMGFLTGLSRTYNELLFLRILLGLFEAGHFPCGLKTIQQLMAPRDRALGNSLLQSGTALGAVLAPQAIKLFMTQGVGGWRRPFLVIGASGTAWVILWLVSLKPKDLRAKESSAKFEVPSPKSDRPAVEDTFWKAVLSWRFLSLAVMVVCVNMNWHFFRVWLPTYLREDRGYKLNEMLNFATFYYIAADLGAISGGILSGVIARQGASVFASRMWVFGGCCLLTTLSSTAPYLPNGPLLLAALLVVGCGGLGAYAAFYSLTQDLSKKHQGKVSGLLATITWLVTSPFHSLFGRYLDQTKNYNLALSLVGWMPMIALVTVLGLWNLGRRNAPGGLAEDGSVTPPG